MKTVAVIDYGMSNLRSVSKALEHVAGNNWQVQVSDQADVILQADKVVFPGQGAIAQCMHLLKESQLLDVIQQSVEEKPFLGICLGLQSLLTRSEENGGIAGFDVISGTVRRFADSPEYKIPHMGWNQVAQQSHPLWNGIPDNSRFYFVHSYYVDLVDVVAGTTAYGGVNFASAVAKDNVFAVQFHPEKSQDVGLKLLENFLNW
jgi:glutamine amidotransferase